MTLSQLRYCIVQLNVHQARKKQKASNKETQASNVTEGKGYVSISVLLDTKESKILRIIMNTFCGKQRFSHCMHLFRHLKNLINRNKVKGIPGSHIHGLQNKCYFILQIDELLH